MTLNYVEITGTFDDGTDSPLSGLATFTPNVTVYASGIPVLTPANPIQAQIIAGQLKGPSGGNLQLLATDNAGLTYLGQTGFLFYTVTVQLAGQTLAPWSFFLASSPSTVDLYSLANTGAGGGGGGGGVSSVTAADTSIVIGGSGSTPTVRTATLDVIASDHPPAANWSNNSKKITSVANGTAAQDAAAFGQIPLADTTASDIQPLGSSAAAGSNGKWADSGHIHPNTGVVASVAAGDTSIVVGGTVQAPTIETGTLDVIASDHPPTGNWSNNSRKITSLANGTAAQDAAAFGQLPSAGSPLPALQGGTGVSAANAVALLAAIGAAALAGAAFTGEVTVQAPVNPSDAATKAYVDSVAQGLDAKPSAKVVATSNLTLSGAQTIDGAACAAGDRVLATGQSTASQNGLWVVAAGAWSRPSDFASGSSQLGAFVFVEGGTAGASSGWVLTGTAAVVVDTGSQTWTQFSGAGEITAGTGLTKAGNTIGLSSPVSPANGGTGQASLQAALNALAGAVTSGQVLRGNGTNVVLAALQAGDIPALAESQITNLVSDLAARAALAGATFTGFLAPAVFALTDAATIAVDASKGNVFTVTLGGNRQFGNPTNLVDGQIIRLRITQPHAGGPFTPTFASAYDFGGGGVPSFTAAADKTDVLAFEYVATTVNGTPLNKLCYLGAAIPQGF